MDPLVLNKIQQSLQALIERKVLYLNDGEKDELSISFLAPDGEFVGDLGTKPVINCYMIGLNEDRTRRRSDPMRTTINQSKTVRSLIKEPKYVDVTYMLTVWSKDVQGSAELEHLLLSYLITGLGAYDFLPEEIQQEFGLELSPFGVKFTLFGSEHSDKVSGQVWQAMGSTPKPTLMLSLSVPILVYEPRVLPVIQEIDRVLKKTN